MRIDRKEEGELSLLGGSTGTIQLPGIYQSLPYYRATGFRDDLHRLYSGCADGGKQELEALFVQFPKPRRFS